MQAKLIHIQPQKFLNPYQVFRLCNDVILVEDMLDLPDPSDYHIVSNWNHIKYIDATYISKFGNVHAFLQNRIREEVPTEYIINRYRSKGLQIYKQFSDLMSRVVQKFRDSLRDELLQNTGYALAKVQLINHDINFVKKLMNYLD